MTILAVLSASSGRADPGSGLKQQAADLQAEEHAALLALYGLDSRLDATRAELGRIHGRLADLRARRADARSQLRLARRTLRVAEQRLGLTLIVLYESQGDDPLAVILGARSFVDAIEGLDNLTRIASSHAAVASEARAARRRIATLSRSLGAQTRETAQLESAAEAKDAELRQARSERAAYLGQIRSESARLAERIAIVEAEARAAAARAEAATAQARAAGSVASFTTPAAPTPEPASPASNEPAPAAAPEPAPLPAEPAPAEPAPIQAPPSGAGTMTVTATAYSGGGTTATGIPVGYGIVAVDPTVIPLGTRMTIPGYGEGVAADTGSGVNGAWIDVWLPTEDQASTWGTKTLTITLH